jgi:hypothetical protein
MLWLLLLLLLLLLLQACRQAEALFAASIAQVLKILTRFWPHAEETEVSPSGPPVASNNDGSRRTGRGSNCPKRVGWLQKRITLPSADKAFNRDFTLAENNYLIVLMCRTRGCNVCTCVTTILIPQTHTHSA